ncbi:MAG: thioredoxin family protein [Dehalococcoidales bacterium]|nr:thioredoxin family protein [Dehalococcoidales bacterium]
MPNKPSVVTPERFASGFTYQQYITQINVNKDQFQKYYATARLSAEDDAFFRRIASGPNGLNKIMVIGEDWCPDVFRGMPLVARIAEAAGIEMRVFPRDQNPDIMNEFLNRGQFMSIPVVVFYTRDLREIGRWVERPEIANREREVIEAAVKQQMPGATDPDVRVAVRERTQARYPAWQQESLHEMRQILAAKLDK